MNVQGTVCHVITDQYKGGKAMFKLRIYKLSGFYKGNLDHEEFFSTREEMEVRYKECAEIVRVKLKQYECHAYFPTVWENVGGDWRKIL